MPMKDTAVVEKQNLALVRTELLMKQEELAKEAGVSIMTISRCENGNPVQLLTAQAVLRAVNKRRKAMEMEPLTLNDLDWKIK